MSPKMLVAPLEDEEELRDINSTYVTFTGTKPVTFRVGRRWQEQSVNADTRKGIPDGGKRLKSEIPPGGRR